MRRGLLIVLGAAVAIGCQRAPTELSQVTWDTLQDSRRQGADSGAPEIWAEARARYDSAWLVIETQNRLWFFERHFEPAESLLMRSGTTALQAVRVARQVREKQMQELQQEIGDLQTQLGNLSAGLDVHLARLPLRQALTEAELKVVAASQSYGIESTEHTQAAVEEAHQALTVLEDRLDGQRPEPGELPQWRRMVDQTVSWSRSSESTAVVVVKTDRKAYVLHQGRIVANYPVEFGYRSWRQKMRAGDGATPEGMYFVTQWRDRGSRYYKALVLNYPNDADRLRFERDRRLGRIPRWARIGGNIEIHGEGGKGGDWTEGCIALRNDHMDRLMKQVGVGTRVTIVRQVEGWPE